MPLWRIYHPSNTFTTTAARDAISGDITKIYTNIGLPAFYVVVVFETLPAEKIYVGGVSNDRPGERPFIRIVFENIARRLDSSVKSKFCDLVDQALKPHIADKGYDWEYHGIETDRQLWKIQGQIPPDKDSEAEQVWRKENRPIPYQ